MSRTKRRNYRGESMRDGEHGKNRYDECPTAVSLGLNEGENE